MNITHPKILSLEPTLLLYIKIKKKPMRIRGLEDSALLNTPLNLLLM